MAKADVVAIPTVTIPTPMLRAGRARPATARSVCLSRHLVLGGTRLHYLEWLPDEPATTTVVLIHGGGGCSYSWSAVGDLLREKWRVLALDCRGHGDSEWSRSGAASIGDWAQDLSRFVSAVGGEHVAVIGHSRGGYAVLRSIIDGMGPIAAVIVDVGLQLISGGMQKGLDTVLEERRFGTAEAAATWLSACGLAANGDDAEQLVPYQFTVDSHGEFVPKHDPRAFASDASEISAGRLPRGAPHPDELRGLDVPLLLVRGERSGVLSASSADDFVSTAPNASLATVMGARHAPHLQNVEGFVGAVQPFIANVVAQAMNPLKSCYQGEGHEG